MANNHHSLQIPEKRLKISVDYREKTSGIVELLNRSGFIVHSKSLKHTCQLMRWMGQQFVKLSDGISPRSGHRPKRQLSKQLYVLQGLPNVGPTLSKKLLGHFKSVRNVMTANEKKLLQVAGIGPKKVKAIQKVLE